MGRYKLDVWPTVKEARDAVVRARRTPCTPPRMCGDVEVHENPAPDWVWELCDLIAKHVGATAELDGGFAIMSECVAWCEAGDAPVRSFQVEALVENWIGPRVPMLREFLDNARKLDGRHKL